MTFCPNCGASVEAGATFCPKCGTSLAAQQPQYTQYQQPQYDQYNQYQQPGQAVTIEEFRKNYADPAHYKTLKTLSIIAYVFVGINALLALTNIFSLVDAVIQLCLTLGVHKNKSKGCATGILVYAIISMVLSLVLSGSLTGWGWLIIGIGMVSTFKKIDQQYQAQNGMVNQTYQNF